MIYWLLFLGVHSILTETADSSHHEKYHAKKVHDHLHERDAAYAAVLGGNGQIADGWPGVGQWVDSLETMFERNKGTISASCAEWGLPNISEDETVLIKDAIYQVGKSSGVDERFIFAIVMQESKGCVRVQTTDNGVANPGIMQSHDGSGFCNQGGVIQNPCPRSEILQMIQDGVEGTPAGPGLQALIGQEGGTADVASYYKAARAYTSGAVASSGNLGQGGATHCYVSDVANRLLGWIDGPSLCAPDRIGQLSAALWDDNGSVRHTDRNGTSTTTTGRILAPTHGFSSSSSSISSSLLVRSSVIWRPAQVSSSPTLSACRRKAGHL